MILVKVVGGDEITFSLESSAGIVRKTNRRSHKVTNCKRLEAATSLVGEIYFLALFRISVLYLNKKGDEENGTLFPFGVTPARLLVWRPLALHHQLLPQQPLHQPPLDQQPSH
jgi:hypothetical protein